MKEILAAFFGALFGAIGSYYFAKRIIDRQELHRSGAKFRKAFVKEIEILSDEFDLLTNELGERSTYEVLSSSRYKHKIAMLQFRPYLSGATAKNFDVDWRDFCGDCEATKKECLLYYAELDAIEEKQMKKIALERINKLMRYTLPKDYLFDLKNVRIPFVR